MGYHESRVAAACITTKLACSMTKVSPAWVCCQLGAREHYAIARALHAENKLLALITEAWVPPASSVMNLSERMTQRFHADLCNANVYACNWRSLLFEFKNKAASISAWPLILSRNAWFQQQALKRLDDIAKTVETAPNSERAPLTLFCYSYTALHLFRWAKAKGWRTVLGQIDGGHGDAKWIAKKNNSPLVLNYGSVEAPAVYWQQWKQECELADKILVNSEWSKKLLLDEGIAADKLVVIPVAYSSPPDAEDFQRTYPKQFDQQRKLRVLFLGQISARKGAVELLEAAKLLTGQPIEFWLVGPQTSILPEQLKKQENIRWFGVVPRDTTADYYRDADVFIFPTHSDGFGLTQLEAQAWKLPVIATQYCGEVVKHGINGLKLDQTSAGSIAHALEGILQNPLQLAQWSENSVKMASYSLTATEKQLTELFSGQN